MENKKIGIGIIGASEAGWAVQAHLPALMKLKEQFEVVAVSTTHLNSAQATAEIFNVPNAFDNEYDLINFWQVDLVVIAVKVPNHYHLVKTALDAGKMIYCEWPLGNGTKEAEDLTSLALSKNIKTFVGLQARQIPELKYVKDYVVENHLGKVLSTTIIGAGDNWGTALPNEALAYLLDPKNGATMMHIPFAQTLDGVEFCLGEFKEISAILARGNNETLITSTNKTVPQLSNDQIIVNGVLRNGAVASIHYRGGVSKSINLYWEIKCNKGEIIITSPTGHLQFGKLQIQIATDGQEIKDLEIPPSYKSSDGGNPGINADLSRAVYYAYKAVADDIKNGTNTVASFADAIIRHKFLDSIEKASASGCKEPIQPPIFKQQ